MNSLKALYKAVLEQDINILSQLNIIWLFYLLICIILILENGFLPVSFLPGDSLLILLGILISKNILNFYFIVFLLTISASIGSWIGYLQGKWLKSTPIINLWISKLPKKYFDRAYHLFCLHGFFALFIGRFVVFVRTILPIFFGLSGFKSSKFYFFNVVSAFFWVSILILIGFLLGKTWIFNRYENIFITILCTIPTIIIVFSIIYLLKFWIKKN